jgi:hypothetical protein
VKFTFVWWLWDGLSACFIWVSPSCWTKVFSKESAQVSNVDEREKQSSEVIELLHVYDFHVTCLQLQMLSWCSQCPFPTRFHLVSHAATLHTWAVNHVEKWEDAILETMLFQNTHLCRSVIVHWQCDFSPIFCCFHMLIPIPSLSLFSLSLYYSIVSVWHAHGEQCWIESVPFLLFLDDIECLTR